MKFQDWLTTEKAKTLFEQNKLITDDMPISVLNDLAAEGYPTKTEIGGTAGKGIIFSYIRVKDGERQDVDLFTIDEFLQVSETGLVTIEDTVFFINSKPTLHVGYGIRYPTLLRLTNTAKAFNIRKGLTIPTDTKLESTEFLTGRFMVRTVEFEHGDEKSIESYLNSLLLPRSNIDLVVKVADGAGKGIVVGFVQSTLFFRNISTLR